MEDLLKVEDLRIAFQLPEGRLEAVRGVSFRIRPGSTVALVGESGSGKSVVSQAIMGILPKAASIEGGRILFADPVEAGAANGEATAGRPIDIATLRPDSAEMRRIRGGRISIIFQEPMTSLSPVHTVGNQIVDRTEGEEICIEMLRLVGFPNPAKALRTYPFELSGGLRQRAMIAMALVCRPALLVADEPTTALDVTIQAQILKLLADLQQELGMAVLMITHDLGVVANVAEEVVMESGTLDDIFRRAEHPYLKALLHAVPRFNMARDERLRPIREIKHDGGSPLLRAKDPWPSDADQKGPMLAVEHVTKHFTNRKAGLLGSQQSQTLAVDDVSFTIKRGECLGLVGESGCGKTTLSKIIMRALSTTAARSSMSWLWRARTSRSFASAFSSFFKILSARSIRA
jgi:peptide/nickel transport system ATP-binding protein